MKSTERRSVRDGLQYIAYQSKNPVLAENALTQLAVLQKKWLFLDCAEVEEPMHAYEITDQLNESFSNSKICVMTAVYGITILIIATYISAINKSLSEMC